MLAKTVTYNSQNYAGTLGSNLTEIRTYAFACAVYMYS